MSAPKVRLDDYGQPRPALSEARTQVLRDTPVNHRRRRLIALVLEDQHHELLRRGIYAEVAVHYAVKDGVIKPGIQLVITRTILDEGDD